MITAHIDGGSRGNPGPAGYGVQIVEDDGSVIAELHEAVGTATNNVASMTVKDRGTANRPSSVIP